MLMYSLRISTAFICALVAIPTAASAQEGTTAQLTAAEALNSDATNYARVYGVSLDEAKRRMLIMAAAGPEVGRLETEVSHHLSGSYFSHDGTFALVVRLTGGAALPSARTLSITTDRPDLGPTALDLPVRFEAAGGVTRERAKQIVEGSQDILRSLFPTLQGFGYDERSGELSILVEGTALQAPSLRLQGGQLAQQLGMPVRIDVAPVRLAPRNVRGGAPLYLSDGTPWCTSAFVAQDPAGRVGVLTAGHCNEQQYWRQGSTNALLNRTAIMFNRWEDWAFLTTNVAMVPEFFGNRNEGARVLRGRRTKENTTERTSVIAGSYICAYGRNTGPRYGQSCGEVTNKYYNPNYPHPGCTNGSTYVACAANYVEIRPRGSETMYCIGGDSGAPIFTFDVAWGILSGCATYANSERTYNIIYTSIDELYFNGYALRYGS
jgi:hypothetical protein